MAAPTHPDVPVIEQLNPLQHVKAEEYSAWWSQLFNTVLNGFWAKLFFFLLLSAAFYVGVRQRNPTLAAICIVLAAIVAYGAGLIDLFKSL